MARFVRAARAADIPPGTGKVVTVEGRTLALFNVDGRYHCIDNACIHRGGPLGEGILEGTLVTCPWHHWQFDVVTGQCRTNEEARMSRYEVKIEGEDLLIGL